MEINKVLVFNCVEVLHHAETCKHYIAFLAVFYKTGDTVDQDFSKAFELFEKSAQREYAESQLELGLFYELGVGTAKNHQKAV